MYVYFGCLLMVLHAHAHAATAYRPNDDAQVLVELHRGGTRSIDREAKALRSELKEHPGELAPARRLAQLLMEQARRESDPRYLGQAEAVLGPWWRNAAAPTDVLILRATIEQSRHQFDDALKTLNEVLARDPRAAGAWLTQATILTLRGDYVGARRACGTLVRLTDLLTALTATAAVGGVTGEAERSLKLLEVSLTSSPSAPPATLAWSHAVAGDLAERLDRPSDAERHYLAALALAPRDPFGLSIWADFLLNQHRETEVLSLLASETDKDALLLRFAEAKAATSPGGLASIAPEIARLAAGFAAARRHGVHHAREEARFQLHLRGAPMRACQLARENWEQQREPADLRLLQECGQAAHDQETLAVAQLWVRTNRLEDAVLQRLTSHP